MNNPADEISQALKRKILAEDRQRLATYHAHGQAAIDDERQGRFGALNKTTVVGANPAIQYPRQPEGSPWASDPGPTEPPLGYNVNDQECVGEHFERGDAAAPEPSDGGLKRRGWRRL